MKYPQLEAALKALEIDYTAEYLFAKDVGREWAADFYFEKNGRKLALEVEGGIFAFKREDGTVRRGAHGSIGNALNDMTKYNHYAFCNIALLRILPDFAIKEPIAVAKAVKSYLSGECDFELLANICPKPKKKKARLDVQAWLIENGWKLDKVVKANSYYRKQVGKAGEAGCCLNSRFFSLVSVSSKTVMKKQPLPKTKTAAQAIFSNKNLL